MEFDWDPDKADSNLAKHGIDFSAAIQVFDDPKVLTRAGLRGYGEQRYQAIGMVKGSVLFVVYTMRGDTTRIISARRASRRERTIYSLQARD